MGLTLKEVDQANYQRHCFEALGKREQVDFQYHDEEKWHLQVFSACSIKDWKVADLKRKKGTPSQQDSAYYFDRRSLIRDQQELIEQHVDRRIQLFFQQAILCYNTPFFYDAEGAEDQIGIGAKIALLGKQRHETQAAHSSTFPCLYAYPKDATGNIDRAKRFVYLKYSHSYNQHNSTVELPIEVNQTDTDLDGTVNQAKLRAAGIKIINEVAQGKLNPTKATKKFLVAFEKQLVTMQEEDDIKDIRRDILAIYLNHLREVKEELQQSPEIFDRIMGVTFSQPEKILRNVVYKKRYELIQQAEFIDSQIAKRIFLAQKQMLGNRVKSLKSVDYRLRYILLQQTNEQERKFFEKLFCTSLSQLTTNLENKQEKLRRIVSTVSGFERKHAAEIQNLLRDLRVFRRDLQKLEVDFRSKLFKGLREDFKGWYQKDFVAQFRQNYPLEPMSRPMVSRLEQASRLSGKALYLTPENQRRKEIDIAKAQKIAHTYGVDVGLFLPGLLSSEY